jgi:hypothetical protein
MSAYEAPVQRDARQGQARANVATTVAVGLVVGACGVYAYQQLAGADAVKDGGAARGGGAPGPGPKKQHARQSEGSLPYARPTEAPPVPWHPGS